MSQLLMDLNSEALTSLVEDSPANLTPLQEAARRLVTSVISGENSGVLWGKRDRHGCWQKTSQDSLALNLDDSSGEYKMIWPRWGTAWDGLVMEHPTPERFTVETEFSSLPTPRSCSAMGAAINPNAQFLNLETIVARQMLPTPTAVNRVRSPETMQKCADFRKRNANQNTVPLYLEETVLAQSVAEIGESGESAQRLGLNPEFVEAMMGLPTGWTDLKH
jgi:hypothetical protein